MTGSDDELDALVKGADDDDGFFLEEDPTYEAVVFRVGGWWFSLAPTEVEEIHALEGINRAPSLPSHVLGLVLLKNRLVPVVDLRRIWPVIPDGPTPDGAQRIVLVTDGVETLGFRAEEARAIVEVTEVSAPAVADAPFVIGAGSWNDNHIQSLSAQPLLQVCLNS